MDAFNNPDFETDYGTISPTGAEGLTKRDVDEAHLLRVTATWADMLPTFADIPPMYLALKAKLI